jgi:hypothetical protein
MPWPASSHAFTSRIPSPSPSAGSDHGTKAESSDRAARVKPAHAPARPVRAVRETADGYTDRPTGPNPVRYASVAPRTQRHPPVQGGTPRHTDETAR